MSYTKLGRSYCPKRELNEITKVDRKVYKPDDLFKRAFKAGRSLSKAITDIMEIKARDGNLYMSALFDCFNLVVLGLAMADNMKAYLCVTTIRNAGARHSELKGAKYIRSVKKGDMHNILVKFIERLSKAIGLCRVRVVQEAEDMITLDVRACGQNLRKNFIWAICCEKADDKQA